MIHVWCKSLISGSALTSCLFCTHWTSPIQSHCGLTRNTCIYNYHPRYARMNKSKYFTTHWLLCISAVEWKNVRFPVCLIAHTDMTGFSCKWNKTLSGRSVVIIIQINLILRAVTGSTLAQYWILSRLVLRLLLLWNIQFPPDARWYSLK